MYSITYDAALKQASKSMKTPLDMLGSYICFTENIMDIENLVKAEQPKPPQEQAPAAETTPPMSEVVDFLVKHVGVDVGLSKDDDRMVGKHVAGARRIVMVNVNLILAQKLPEEVETDLRACPLFKK